MDWNKEWPIIKMGADRYGIDPYFIISIRSQENGGPGKEFGVLSISAPTYEEQLNITCGSVLHRLVDYATNDNPLCTYQLKNGQHRLVYNDSFIKYFSGIWAPIGANNDPTGLNINWFTGVRYFYYTYLNVNG